MKRTTEYVPFVVIVILGGIANLFWISMAHALPMQGEVVAGSSSVSRPDTRTLEIRQASPRSVIDWASYSIGREEQVRYLQPGRDSISLNRVTGVDPSYIEGNLRANGQVWIVNPNGLLVGPGARIEAGGFLASTLNIDTQDFVSGRYRFSADKTRERRSFAEIINKGSIETPGGGYVVFIGPSVVNQGELRTPGGRIGLAAGEEITVDFSGNGLIGLAVDRGVAAGVLGVQNDGLLSADGGEITLSARVTDGLLRTVINNDGVIEAHTIDKKGGVIRLLGDMDHGRVAVNGVLDASAPAGGDGGFIETSAARVDIGEQASITTESSTGKYGTWLIDPADYIIAPIGGDITGTAVSSRLSRTNVTIQINGFGNIYVADVIAWASDTTLRMDAIGQVLVSSDITATGNAAGLVTGANLQLATGARITLSGANPTLVIGQPYTVINDIYGLQAIKNNLGGRYALGSDIDASVTTTWNGGLGFEPIGDLSISFSGILNGLNHTVNGLHIDRAIEYVNAYGVPIGRSVVGLIAQNAGVIKNIGLENVDVGGRSWVGELVGLNYGSVMDSYVTGVVTGRSRVGGLAGENGCTQFCFSMGRISRSFSEARVAGFRAFDGDSVDAIGGLVGVNAGTIYDSYSSGSLDFSSSSNRYISPSFVLDAGGLVGINKDLSSGFGQSGVIGSSYSVSTISRTAIDNMISGSGESVVVGGLVAENYGQRIGDSYSSVDPVIGSRFGSTGNVLGNVLGGLSPDQIVQQAMADGWNFDRTWIAGQNGPRIFTRWNVPGIGLVPSFSQGTQGVSSPAGAAADFTQAEHDWLNSLRTLDSGQVSPRLKAAEQLLMDLARRGPIVPAQSELALARLQKLLQGLTPDQAARLALAKDPLGGSWLTAHDLQVIAEWVRKSYLEHYREELAKARRVGEDSRTIELFEQELGRYEQVARNLEVMLAARRVEDGFLVAFYDKARLSNETIDALRSLDPTLRRAVYERIVQRADFDVESTQDEYLRLARSITDGTLDAEAERLARRSERMIELWYRSKLEQMREAGADAEREYRTQRAQERQKWLQAMFREYRRMQEFVRAQGTGNAFEQQATHQVYRKLRKMLALHRKLEDKRQRGEFSIQDQVRFDALRRDVNATIDTLYSSTSDYYRGQAKDLGTAIRVAEMTRDYSLKTLNVLSSATGAPGAAKVVSLVANGATGFIDAAFVKKDPVAVATFSTIINTAVKVLPGGKALHEKVALDLTKQLLKTTETTVRDLARGKLDPAQAEGAFVKRFVTAYEAKAVEAMVRNSASGSGNLVHGMLEKMALKYYRVMTKEQGA